MNKVAFIVLLTIALSARCLNAQEIFYSSRVDSLYRLISQVCTMSPIYGSDTILQCSGLIKGDTIPIIISKDENGVVNHIGYCFLPDSIKTTDNAVMQFVEREILTILTAKDANTALRTDYEIGLQIQLDSIPKTSGLLQDKKKLSSLLKDCRGYTINRMNKDYDVIILCSDGRRLTFSFPADCKLISGMNKSELEIKLAFQLKNHVAKTIDSLILSPDTDYLQLLEDSVLEECIYVEKGSEFILPHINNDLFYLEGDSIYSLVSDTSMVSWSFSNAMLVSSEKHYTIDIKHKMYGFVVQEYTIDSRDFNDFFSQGYNRFFGIETLETENLSGTMVLYNYDEEYIHLAYVTTTLDDLIKGGKITMELYSNIPQHNIKTLYYGENKTEQK